MVSSAAPTDAVAEMPAPPAVEVVEARWLAAAEGLSIEPRPEGPRSIAWAAPCKLTYALRWERLFDVAPGRARAGPRSHAALEVVPDGDEAIVQLVGLRTDRFVDGRPTAERTPSVDASVRVRWSPTAWSPTEEGRRLWLADGSVPALGAVFPTLPRALSPGARVEWKVQRLEPPVAARLERRRAEGKKVPRVVPEEESRSAELTSWSTVEGVPAATFEGTFQRHVDDQRASLARSLEAWRAQWVVLASGRLLHAALVAEAWRGAQAVLGDERSRRGTLAIEMRLVEACDGPTLPGWE